MVFSIQYNQHESINRLDQEDANAQNDPKANDHSLLFSYLPLSMLVSWLIPCIVVYKWVILLRYLKCWGRNKMKIILLGITEWVPEYRRGEVCELSGKSRYASLGLKMLGCRLLLTNPDIYKHLWTNVHKKFLEFWCSVCKSGKLIPTMVLGVLFFNKKFKWFNYISALLISLAVATFTLAGSNIVASRFCSRSLCLFDSPK